MRAPRRGERAVGLAQALAGSTTRLRRTACDCEGSAAIEALLLIAGVVLPFGAFMFWMMRTLVEWFYQTGILVEGPFL